jgi:PhzF family phenazine biosynthesis protein
MTTRDSSALGVLQTSGVLRYAAFTQDGAGGNPAGVVLNANTLDDAERLTIAAEVGYSETAFVEAEDQDGHYRVRYFSPRAEVTFCGHATIATAVALAERRGAGDLLFNTLAGPVPVRTEASPVGYTATLTSVPTRTRAAEVSELDAALAALRWRHEDLDLRYPAHVAYAGNHHLILAVRSRTRLAELDYDFDALGALMDQHGWTTVHLVHAHDPLLFSARTRSRPAEWRKTRPPVRPLPPSAATCATSDSSSRPPTSPFSRARTWAGPAVCTFTSPLTTSGYT